MIKRVFKYLLIITAGIILLVILFLIFTQTAPFRRMVKNQVIKIAESKLNTQLEIDQIDGNFYSNLEFVDVSISKNNNAIVSFSSLKLNYNLWALRNRQIVADTVILKNPSFNIRQEPDSIWNFI